MKKIIAFVAFGVVGLMVLQLYVNSENANPDNYLASVVAYRQQKDEHLRTDENSPFGITGRFKSLNYFEVNPKFKIEATLQPLRDTTSFLMRMSDGSRERFRKQAFVVLLFDSVRDTLFLYKKYPYDADSELFAPFTDETNGNATYDGGRYLDISAKTQGKITIDFNFAYNPYCVYNYNYTCPIPPRENRLRVAIEAGEKMYAQAKTKKKRK